MREVGAFALWLALAPVGCHDSSGIEATSSGGGPADVEIPSASNFSDAGRVLTAGGAGAWDLRLDGSYSPGLLVELNGTQFLYYIGADGNRGGGSGPNQRRLGVATSTDWTNWTEHPSNPLLDYSPNSCSTDSDEEGFFSVTGGVYDGTLYLFAGVMIDDGCNGSVDADPHLWTSTDGINFTYHGESVSATGGESYALAAWRDDAGTWHLYYIDSAGGSGDVGYATGSDPAALTNEGLILRGVDRSGGGLAVKKSETELIVALMSSHVEDDIHIYTPTQADPGTLSSIDATWSFPDVQNATLYLDRTNDLWRVFHTNRDFSEIRQLTAPVTYR